MARIREFDEQKALTEAMYLFWEKGYEATTLNDLTTRMGIQKPSLYSAYGDKSSLFEAALRHYNQQHAKYARSKLNKITSVKVAFRNLFHDGVFPDGDHGRSGCFCINTMVELAPHDAKFEILTREHQQYLAAIFEDTLNRGVTSNEIDGTVDCRAIAQTLVVALIGITVLKKSNPSPEWIDNYIDSTLSLLASPLNGG
ncbi:TetR/AcrR family transcriptional regulator [Paenibacillus allorhizosphaerae]|uniref:HTH-type transcriptional repressor ComR n=1 Tax=Paenibacillus allorhizosphaerae TaxID=2849866 RepID=A0ABM8VSZ9_9BACL|nr:TetR/AcrR family transcriptional regulator [Paenibacillus allorhizosphaerae]CAG7656979.1 HTH-type transcriptional repressor ComR [Paenibacillus allorhizosphaerae]